MALRSRLKVILVITVLIVVLISFLTLFPEIFWRERVVEVPETYFDFIMNYAPYVYVIPGSGPDLEWGKSSFAAAFAIDFLYQAYYNDQFEDRKADIYDKIVSLSDWILTQQCTDESKKAYGGFKSNENSTYYYSADACKVIPSLLRAYKLTGKAEYLNAAKLAGNFLYNMQHLPSQLGIHDKYYGGFARAVTIDDSWLREMNVECLYGIIGLQMLSELDAQNKSKHENMITDALNFYRSGIENLWLYFDPPPSGDGNWHRIGLNETEIYDDTVAYALIGLYEYEGWSQTVEKVYNLINTIRASSQYPAYNPAVCWAGYIDVVSRFPACEYYDAVTAGILWKIRKNHDKSSFEYSMKIIGKHAEDFMFWGVKFDDYSPVENKQAMATVCWLAQFFLNYEDPTTPFTRFLKSYGENITIFPIREASDTISYGEGVDVKAVVSPTRVDEVLMEPGYAINDYITIYLFVPLRHHDKIRRKGVDYEVLSIQEFSFKGDILYRRAVCRRLLGQ